MCVIPEFVTNVGQDWVRSEERGSCFGYRRRSWFDGHSAGPRAALLLVGRVENPGHSSSVTALPVLLHSGRRRHVGLSTVPGRPRRSLTRETLWVGMWGLDAGDMGQDATDSMAAVQTVYRLGQVTPSGLGDVGFVWLSPGHVLLVMVQRPGQQA